MTNRPCRRTIGWGYLESCCLEQARATAVDASWRPIVYGRDQRILPLRYDNDVPRRPTSMPWFFYALHRRRAGVLLETTVAVRGLIA
jgi:hypothetical protein